MNLSPLTPVRVTPPHRRFNSPVRFAAKKDKTEDKAARTDQPTMSWEEMVARSGELHDVLKSIEIVPDRLRDLVHQLLNGDSGLARQLEAAIHGFLSEIDSRRGFERLGKEGVRVTAGTFERTFEHRTNIFPTGDFDFAEFLNHHSVFGKKKRVLVSLTGWTKPPAHYLQQDTVFKELLAGHPEEEWPQISEKLYVGMIKQFLERTVDQLKQAGYSTSDLAFLYGVTPIGVDRAIEEFCDERGIRYAGVTCYDWMPYVEDASGKKPFFLAKDAKEFARCMASYADLVLVMGGRAYASNITESGKNVRKGKKPFVSVDLFAENGIQIPAAVLSDLDGKTSIVENAAAVLRSNSKSDPAKQIKRLKIQNPDNLAPSVMYVTHLLKSALDKLNLVKAANSKAVDKKKRK